MNLQEEKVFISNLKVKAFRDSDYLAWLRRHKCFACRTNGGFYGDVMIVYERVTASHIFRSYHGLKNHDWAAVPMCGECHWIYEYHKDNYEFKFGRLPTADDAEKFYQKYLKETGKEDLRTKEQMVPI